MERHELRNVGVTQAQTNLGGALNPIGGGGVVFVFFRPLWLTFRASVLRHLGELGCFALEFVAAKRCHGICAVKGYENNQAHSFFSRP